MKHAMIALILFVINLISTPALAQPADSPVTIIAHEFYVGPIHTGMRVADVGREMQIYGPITRKSDRWCAGGDAATVMCTSDKPWGPPGIVNSIDVFDKRFYMPHAGGVRLGVGGLGMGFIAVFGQPTSQETMGNTIFAYWTLDASRGMRINVQIDAPSNEVQSVTFLKDKH